MWKNILEGIKWHPGMGNHSGNLPTALALVCGWFVGEWFGVAIMAFLFFPMYVGEAHERGKKVRENTPV